MNFKFDKFPIVIIASPRTGSSALAKFISNEYNLIRFEEPFMRINDFLSLSKKKQHACLNDRKQLSTYLKESNYNFILKLIVHEITTFSPYQDLFKKDCFKIKLTRNCVHKQIASAYIAKCIKKNHTYDDEIIDDYVIKINNLELIDTIEFITNANFVVNNLNISYDLDLKYEDFGVLQNAPNKEGKKLIVNKKPNNYDEILFTIKKLISTFKYQ